MFAVDWWWVRIWDCPRLQLAVAYLLGLVLLWLVADKGWERLGLTAILGVAFLYQLTWIVPYLPLASVQTQAASSTETNASIRISIANVLMTNRAVDRLRAPIDLADSDVLILTELDVWWADQRRELKQAFPSRTSYPLDNTYGMLFYSRLPGVQSEVTFLKAPDIPCIHARLRLRSDALVELIFVYPCPPRPTVDTAARDAELILVGHQAKSSPARTIVVGNLNDVGWSQTTRLFQKIGGLLDPRRGRGLYAAYHADAPGLRYALDHLCHARQFGLRQLTDLDHFSPDHFPLLVELSYEPERKGEQERPRADATERQQAQAKLERLHEER